MSTEGVTTGTITPHEARTLAIVHTVPDSRVGWWGASLGAAGLLPEIVVHLTSLGLLEYITAGGLRYVVVSEAGRRALAEFFAV